MRSITATLTALVITLGLIFGAAPAFAGFSSAKKEAVRALKKADKAARRKSKCKRSAGARIKTALKRAKKIRSSSDPERAVDVEMFVAGVIRKLDRCPESVEEYLHDAESALEEMKEALADNEGDDEDDEEHDAEGHIEGKVRLDSFGTERGKAALFMEIQNMRALDLRGEDVLFKLVIKRKNKRSWKRAPVVKYDKAYHITRDDQGFGNISFTAGYQWLVDNKRLRPGVKYDAKLIGTADGHEVFSYSFWFNFGADQLDRRGGGGGGGGRAMSQRAFNGFHASLRSTRSDFSKLDMIRSIAKKNYFTAQQLGKMMDQTRSDFTRMDIAKAIVPKLVDKENAFGHAQKFTSSFSRQDFTKLLAN